MNFMKSDGLDGLQVARDRKRMADAGLLMDWQKTLPHPRDISKPGEGEIAVRVEKIWQSTRKELREHINSLAPGQMAALNRLRKKHSLRKRFKKIVKAAKAAEVPPEPYGSYWGVARGAALKDDDPHGLTGAWSKPSGDGLTSVLKALMLIIRREMMDQGEDQPFQLPQQSQTAAMTNYYPESVWKEDKDYFVKKREQAARAAFQKQQVESGSHNNFCAPDDIEYAFDRSSSTSKKYAKRARRMKRPAFQGVLEKEAEVGTALPLIMEDKKGGALNWQKLQARAWKYRRQRCEHLLHTIEKEQGLELDRQRTLQSGQFRSADPAVLLNQQVKFAKERAEAADKCLRILQDYKLITGTEMAAYLKSTLEGYKAELGSGEVEDSANMMMKDMKKAKKNADAMVKAEVAYLRPYPRMNYWRPSAEALRKFRSKPAPPLTAKERVPDLRSFEGIVFAQKNLENAKNPAQIKLFNRLTTRGIFHENLPPLPAHLKSGVENDMLHTGKSYAGLFGRGLADISGRRKHHARAKHVGLFGANPADSYYVI